MQWARVVYQVLSCIGLEVLCRQEDLLAVLWCVVLTLGSVVLGG